MRQVDHMGELSDMGWVFEVEGLRDVILSPRAFGCHIAGLQGPSMELDVTMKAIFPQGKVAPHGQNCHAQTMMVHEVHSMPGYGRGLCGKPLMCRYVWTPGSLCSTKVEGYCTCYKLGGGSRSPGGSQFCTVL